MNTTFKLDEGLLIAEFMGYKQHSDTVMCDYLYNHNTGLLLSKAQLDGYSVSWNALMPVVDQINSIGYGSPEIRISKHRTEVFYSIPNEIEKARYFTLQISNKISRMESVYQSVIVFINWYNLSK